MKAARDPIGCGGTMSTNASLSANRTSALTLVTLAAAAALAWISMLRGAGLGTGRDA